MMLPISLANVMVTAGIFLWAGRDGLAAMGVVEWIAILAFISLSAAHKTEPAHALPQGSHGSAS
jgi:hypothetical protein